MKHLIFVMTVVTVITLSAPALHSAQGTPDQNASAKRTRRMAMITAARTINVAEVDEQMATGRFEDWKTLAQSEAIQKANVQVPVKVDVRVFSDADGKRFSVVLKDMQDPCLYTIFSDETGIIFQGQVVQGCPE
jgi:type II secretory pathway component PulK